MKRIMRLQGFILIEPAKIKEWEVESLIEHGRMLVEIRKYEDAVILLEKAQVIDPQLQSKALS